MAVGVQQQAQAVGSEVSAAPQELWRDPKWSQYKVGTTLGMLMGPTQ
jgi:hypothetical protein